MKGTSLITHIAVCGAGAFGRNHIRIYRELAASGVPVRLAAVVEPDPASISALAAAGIAVRFATGGDAPVDPANKAEPPDATDAVAIYPNVDTLIADVAHGVLRIDAASVCVPTTAHYAVSAQLLEAGIHVLVEKPITSTIEQADTLIRVAREHSRVLMVGHLERFNPAVQALRPLLRGPMFFEAHRLSVLDLMIHDLDIVLQLAQSEVTSVHAVGLPILSSRTDIANVRVEFSSGCVANFTASRVSTERVRKLRFFQPHQYLSVDYARQDLLLIEVQSPPRAVQAPGALPEANLEPVGISAPLALTGQAAIGFPSTPPHQGPRQNGPSPVTASPATAPLPSLGMHKPVIAPGEPLRLEIEAFLHAIQTGSEPAVTGEQARAALALALQIQQTIAKHAEHAGLQEFLAQAGA